MVPVKNDVLGCVSAAVCEVYVAVLLCCSVAVVAVLQCHCLAVLLCCGWSYFYLVRQHPPRFVCRVLSFTPSPFLSFTILLFPRLIHITFSHIYFPLSITQSLLQIAHEASAIAGVNSRAQLAHLTSLLGIEQESLRESAESYRDVEAKYQALRITVAEKDVLLKRY